MWDRTKEVFESVRRETAEVKREARKQTAQYLLAAFGLVAGLAWNEAIKTFIETLFPLEKDSLLAKFVYALLITLVVVLVSVYLARLMKGKEGEPKN